MANYTIQIRDNDGSILGEFTKWKKLTYTKQLNGVGTCSFITPWNNDELLKLTSLRRYQVYIYRDNTLLWAGEQAMRAGTLQATNPNWIEIYCYDWIELLNTRYTGANRTFTVATDDAGGIAWTLINDSQNLTDGDYGITQGTIEATKNRDRIYSYKNIMEAIMQLSEVQGGFDFEITNDKVFNVYARKGRDLSPSLVFEYGTNFQAASIEEDFTKPANQALVLGSGFGSSQQVNTDAVDTSSRSTHKLRQRRLNETDTADDDTLEDKGEAIVRRFKQPQTKINFTQLPNTQPAFGSLELGDIIKMKIKEGIYNINNKYRIYGWRVRVGDTGEESVEYITSSQL